MTGSFGIDVSLHLEDRPAVLIALLQLAKPPGWLVAVEDLGRVRTDFEGAVPELGAGVPTLVRVKFKRAHLEDGHWVTLHRLTVLDEGADSPREIDIRGVLLAPGTEAPAEMHFYLPDRRALCMAENATHTLHNLLTLRGALVPGTAIYVAVKPA